MQSIYKTHVFSRTLARILQLVTGSIMFLYPATRSEESDSLHGLCFMLWLIMTYFGTVPRVVACERGVRGDSLFFRNEIPWSAIECFEAAMLVVVRLRGGRRIAFSAIQRAQASVYLRRESEVDRVAADLNAMLDAAGSPRTAPGPVQRRLLVTIPAVLLELIGLPVGLWCTNYLIHAG